MTTDTILEEKEITKQKIKEPSRYKVVVYNDNYTPMEFVVAMFISIFRKSQPDAVDLTLKIHNDGKAVAGTYSAEVAEQKAAEAVDLARSNGHPLILKVEQE
jgi:ATP-dependent Clp protease adaptor protein ClpS